MQESDGLIHENQSLRDRLKRLSDVSLRITESLDLDTVLQEVVDGARALTNAQYGALAVFDDLGRVEKFTTSGITEEARQRMGSLPKGLGLLGYLNEIREPLRLSDLAQHGRSVGFPDDHPPMKTFLGAPVRHLGEPVGNIYLTEKIRGEEFTPEDEEILVMFASQAAMAIGNAVRYRDERRARGEAETERLRLDTLVDASPVGVLVVDAETRKVVSVNEEAERIIGIPSIPGTDLEEYQNISLYRRADGRQYTLEERPLTRALDHGEAVRAEEILLDNPHIGTVMTLISATPIRAEDGRITSAVAIIQDLTPREEMEKLRSEFIGMVSHELRSPLAAIKGSASTVLDATTPFDAAESRQYFRIIGNQADRMQHLISSLLDITRIESGVLSISSESLKPMELIDEAKNTFLRSGGKHSIKADVPGGLPNVTADLRRAAQVLNNLLTNAAKYSPSSSPITVAAAQDPDSAFITFSVTDDGMGIQEDQLPHLFKKFSRGGDGVGRIAGDGLGLAICKGIVEAHGGRIWAENGGEEGRGARFRFTMPIAEAAEESKESNEPDFGQKKDLRTARIGERTRILTVDDEPQILRSLRNVLTGAGYVQFGTGDPDEAMHFVNIEAPHVIILDLILPGSHGFDLMRRIREVSDAPIIFLSAHDAEENIVKAFQMGADDYVVKPFSPAELLARIEASLRKRAAQGQVAMLRPYQRMDLKIDYARRHVTIGDHEVKLTATEYKLLFELSTNHGNALSHEDLLRRIWGQSEESGKSTLVRAYIKRLRSKLGDDTNNPKYIFTEPQVGYRMPAAA